MLKSFQMSHPILLYDGVCGLCNRLIQFVLRHDHNDEFRFASLQSPFAAQILARHGAIASDLNTVYIVLHHQDPAESLLERSDAAVFILRQLGGFWTITGNALAALPRPLRDWAYRQVANSRYRIFGRYESCPIPSAETRRRFLDQ